MSVPKPVFSRVAIVTGASRGIGAAVALRLAAGGAAVVVDYASDAESAAQVVARIEQLGGRAAAIRADIAKRADVERLFVDTAELFGGVDILVSCAGRTHARPVAIADATDEQFDDIFDVNVKGLFMCLREAALRLRPGGRVINVSSTGVASAHVGHGIYTASKSAVETFTRVLSRELKGRRITVNCVAPGATATEDWLRGKPEALLETIAQLSPLERLGTPEDIAHAIAFLASPEGEWINGQIIRANGGFV